MFDNYAELFARSYYSFLQGASSPEDLVTEASRLNLAAIGLTDQNGVYGIPKAYNAKRQFKDLKLIVGAEIRMQHLPSLYVLARTRRAYGLLCRLLTAAHADRPKGQAALTWEQWITLTTEYRAAGSELFVFPTHDPRLTDQAWPQLHLDYLKRHSEMGLTLLKLLDGRDQEATEHTYRLANTHHVPVVATSMPLYHSHSRRVLQDVLTATRHQTTLSQAGYLLERNHLRHLRSPTEMRELYRTTPDALAATLEIARACTFCPSELRYRYPSEWIPAPHTAQSYLEHRVREGAAQRYGARVPEDVARQLAHELKLIRELEFADYFLTIDEIVLFARSRDILCQGRGSAANSAVCYCLGITAIDPVRMNLLFERFISVERGEPPDIDVDFEHERREEVIQHIYEKYGRHRAAMVSAVVTYQSRSAFRDTAKALGVDVGTLSARKVKRDFESLSKQCATPNLKARTEAIADELTGFPRHLSIHSGGFTLSADPIIEIVPVEPARMPGRTIIQWDKYDLDYLGLLKIDVLALGMLSAVHKTLTAIGKELHEIPPEDPKTYAMIQAGDTVGVFQIESRAQMGMLGRLAPENFYDLVIEVAIMRPGPIQGKMIHPYLRRRRGWERPIYPHPKVKEILGKTLGIPLFQEQVMKLAIELAGFTPGEADRLRRAIGGWRANGSITEEATRLMRGLIASGLPKRFAEEIFEQIQGFGAYGFPESHAASFALIAYATSWLKCHHPAPFVAALLNSQPMGFYAPHTLIDDARRHGVHFLPVDINHSHWDCTLESGSVRMGFRLVVGMHKREADELVTLRPFTTLRDLLMRASIRKDVLYRLALAGTFWPLGFAPRDALWEILKLQNYENHRETEAAHFRPLGLFEQVQKDYTALSHSLTAHPIAALRATGVKLGRHTSADVRRLKHRADFETSGVVIMRQRPPTAKGVMFATLEDEFGLLDLVVKPDVYERVAETFHFDSLVTVQGTLQCDGRSVSILVSQLHAIS